MTEKNKDAIDKMLADVAAKIKEKDLPPLLNRDFVTLDTGSVTGEVIRVMQWNMLAQALSPDNFTKCPPDALKWDVRQLRITEEILRYRPSVLCMEEVDQFSYLQETLMKAGYLGSFYPKPKSPCLYAEENYGPDGCAMFYNSHQLTLVQTDSIILKESGGNSNQVSIICHFQTKTDNCKDFTVAVTHLKAKESPENAKLRKEQITYLTQYLKDKNLDHPIILCGDFNAPPTEPAYDVVKSCDLNLTSVNTHLSQEGKEPKYTTWKVRDTEVCRTIDYIWYSKQGLKVKSVLNMASEKEVGEGRLPSFRYPSDHLSLVCDFILL